MKKFSIFLSFVILILLANPVQISTTAMINSEDGYDPDWMFSDSIAVTDTTYESSFANFILDSEGNRHFVWSDPKYPGIYGSDEDIFHKIWFISNQTWSNQNLITPSSDRSSLGPQLAIDSEDNLHLVWYEYQYGNPTEVYYSNYNITIDYWSVPSMISTETTGSASRPLIIIDNEDNLHVIFQDSSDIKGAGADTDIMHKMLNSATQVWTEMELVSNFSNATSLLADLVIDQDNNPIVVWQDYSNYHGFGSEGSDIYLSSYNDEFGFWESPDLISSSNNDALKGVIEIDNLNDFHVFWVQKVWDSYADDDRYNVLYRMYDSSHNLWSDISVVSSDTIGDALFLTSFVDDDANLHIAWSEQVQAEPTIESLYYKIKRQNEDWNVRGALDFTNSNQKVYSPHLVVDSSGSVIISWHSDQTNFGNEADTNIYMRTFYGTPSSPQLAFDEETSMLSWDAAYGAESYKLYRYEDNGAILFSLTEFLSTNNLQTELNLSVDAGFYYVLTAMNSHGESEMSNSVFIDSVNTTIGDDFNITVPDDINTSAIDTSILSDDELPLIFFPGFVMVVAIRSIMMKYSKKN